MGALRAGRLWLIGGVLAIAVLITATYLLAIKPVYDDTALKESQSADQDVELIKLKSQLADLKTKSNDMATYAAELAEKKGQLPDSYDIPSYLRQLQDTDSGVAVDNNSIGVSAPVAVTGTTTVVGVPITLTAKGDVAKLSKFIERIQNVQKRAVVLNTVSLTVTGETAINISLTAFCAKTTDDDCTVKTS